MYGINDELREMAGEVLLVWGRGMATKLQAADVAGRAGIDVIIAAGNKPDVINAVIEDIPVGTRFYGQKNPMENRKRWIFGAPAAGDIYIDDGAQLAIMEKGSPYCRKASKN